MKMKKSFYKTVKPDVFQKYTTIFCNHTNKKFISIVGLFKMIRHRTTLSFLLSIFTKFQTKKCNIYDDFPSLINFYQNYLFNSCRNEFIKHICTSVPFADFKISSFLYHTSVPFMCYVV